MEDTKIKLRVQGVTNSQIQAGAYALILAEEGMRRIPVIVGTSEAQSIAITLEGYEPPRPHTHDLFLSYTKATGYGLKEVFIHTFEDGVFFAEIVLTNGTTEIRIDSRTSDAIAIALRAHCDIFTTETILKKCGIALVESNFFMENETELLPEELAMMELQGINLEDIRRLAKQLSLLNREELEERMEKAVEEEDYEIAKLFKDELLRREKENNND